MAMYNGLKNSAIAAQGISNGKNYYNSLSRYFPNISSHFSKLFSTDPLPQDKRYVAIGTTEASGSPYRGSCKVSGWIKHARHLKRRSFIALSDGLSHKQLQVVIPSELRGDSDKLTYGSSITAHGELIDSPAKGQLVELQAFQVDLLGANDDTTFPFAVNTTSYTAEYTRQFLHLRAKKPEFAAMLRLRSACKLAIHNYFHRHSYVQIDTPILTSNDCEGAGETFSVNSYLSKEPYFNKQSVNLTVSGQLHLEAINSGELRPM